MGCHLEKPDVALSPLPPGEGLASSGNVWHLEAALA